MGVNPPAIQPQPERAIRGYTFLLAGGLLAIIFLGSADLFEFIDIFAPWVSAPFFPFFLAIHDILALFIALYLAYRLSPQIGAWGIGLFTVLHLYAYLVFPAELPELGRVIVLVLTAIFGLVLVRQQRVLEARLVEMASWDPLTSMFTRSRFQNELEYVLALVQRYGTRGAILLLDLDEFREINQRLGQPGGNAILAQVAELLRRRLRGSDTIARLGGDEFGILLPYTDGQGAQVVAARLQSALRDLAFPILGENTTVNASIGVSLFPEQGTTVEVLLASAQKALEQAKRNGGGKIKFYSEEVPSPPENEKRGGQ